MKTILIPLDLSSDTLALVNYAVPIAAQANATLLLLHVIRKQPYDNGTFDPKTEVHQRMKQEAEIILDQLSRQTFGRGVRSKVLVQDGNPAQAIVQCARDQHADLIVMRRSYGRETCAGEEIVRTASCPVLTWMGTPHAPLLQSVSSRKPSQKFLGHADTLSPAPIARAA